MPLASIQPDTVFAFASTQIYAPTLIRYSDKSFGIVALEINNSAQTNGLVFEHRSESGAKLGSMAIAGNPGVPISYGIPSVDVLKDGKIAIGWTEFENKRPFDAGVGFQVLNAAGSEVIATASIDADPDRVATAINLCSLSNGGFVAVWDEPGYPKVLYGQLFDSNGQKIGTKFAVPPTSDTRSGGSIHNAHVTDLGNGKFVVGYTQQTRRTFDDPVATIFNYDGSVSTPSFKLGNTHEGMQFGVTVENLSGGRWVALWESDVIDQGSFAGRILVAQTFDSNGKSLSGPFVVANDIRIGDGYPAAKILEMADGNLLFAYSSMRQSSYYGATVVKLFNTSGNELASEVELAPSPGGGVISLQSLQLYQHGNSSFSISSFDSQSSALTYSTIDLKKFLGTQGADTWFGSKFDDTIEGNDGDDVFSGGDGNDIINGGSGFDTVTYFSEGAVTLALDGSQVSSGSAATDTLRSIEGIEGSNTGSDRLIGNGEKNTLIGHGGNDHLDGKAGDDFLSGGTGADKLIGAAGEDTASYEHDGRVVVALDGSFANQGDAVGDTFQSIENLIGSATGSDQLGGSAANNKIEGLGGDDTLMGFDGNDTLIGGEGGDTINGGAGIDTVDYSDSGAIIFSLIDPTRNNYTATGDTTIDVENVIGSQWGNDQIEGTRGKNLLQGNGGTDVLSGLGGGDILDGGEGSDTADYAKTDGIGLWMDGSISNEGAALGDILKDIENIEGSAVGADRIHGDSGSNRISGNGGSDQLFGRAGDDFLFGGNGSDLINGGSGTNHVEAGAGDDEINAIDGTDTISAGSGNDLATADRGTKNVSMGDGDDIVKLVSGTAVHALSFISGNDGYDILDLSKFDEAAVLIKLSLSNFARLDRFEEVIGTKFSDSLSGSNIVGEVYSGLGGNDTLKGNGGNDTLFGGTGRDKLEGGLGSDYLEGGRGADIINGDKGKDTASYERSIKGVTVSLLTGKASSGDATGDTLSFIENLIGSRFGSNRLVGNLGANDLVGGADNDTLDGGGGNDFLVGGQGADIIKGGTGSDTVSYYASTAVSIDLNSGSAKKGDATGDKITGIEDVYGSNTGSDILSGDKRDNYIWGAGGNDNINGRNGDDVIEGGVGRDTLKGGRGVDLFVLSSTYLSRDHILDFDSEDYLGISLKSFGIKTKIQSDSNELSARYFHAGPDNKSADKNDYFVFNETDQTLWFDRDGNRSAKPILIATVIGDDITANNFYLF